MKNFGINTSYSLTKTLNLTCSHRISEDKETRPTGKQNIITSLTNIGLTQKLSKSASANLSYSFSTRDDKIAEREDKTYNLTSGISYNPTQNTKATLNLIFGKNIYGIRNEINLSFNHNPTDKISILSSLKFITAKDYSANLFLTEAKINF